MSSCGLLERGTIVAQPTAEITERLQTKFGTDCPFHITCQEADRLAAELNISKPQLMVELIPIARSYAASLKLNRISDFYVGSCAMGLSGDFYLGTNLEFVNQWMSQTVHSEQFSTTNAMCHGEKGLQALAVSAEPCGFCRQFLNELQGADDLLILLPDKKAATLPDLLPQSFGPKNLGIEGGLMTAQEAPIALPKPQGNLADEALKAANHSYAPYTHAPAGVALQTKQGKIMCGWYAENAAYNPTMLPMQAALINLLAHGLRYEDITAGVLVEKGQGLLSQLTPSQSLLASLAPEASFTGFFGN